MRKGITGGVRSMRANLVQSKSVGVQVHGVTIRPAPPKRHHMLASRQAACPRSRKRRSPPPYLMVVPSVASGGKHGDVNAANATELTFVDRHARSSLLS
jgi:hypothetical protein